MREGLSFLGGLLLATQAATGFEPGEKVVVVRPIEMKTIVGSSAPLTPGTMLTVQAVETGRLKVAAGKVGWVDPSVVLTTSEADAHFSKLIASDSRDAGALRARGRLRFEKGDLDRAIADLDQSLKLAANSEAHTIRGFAWKRKGDKVRAMADFDEAIRLNPKDALAWRVRGATWAGSANYQKAVADYSQSIQIDPENPESLHHRALMLGACNDPQYRNGKQAVEDATKACEASGWTNPLFLNGLAIACAEASDFDSAIKWQTKAMELSPPDQAKAMSARLEQYRRHESFRMTWR